jgi:hypothetical protein
MIKIYRHFAERLPVRAPTPLSEAELENDQDDTEEADQDDGEEEAGMTPELWRVSTGA